MKTMHIVCLLLCLSAWTISCFPSKPLNERSTELTWQAWLLIDESQNKQQDNTLRRRITPKSVFIAPTFSPENLPECSEGYQSDSMGRCIKIIMLNKELHLDFLLQQLNQKFGGMEDYEDEEGTTTGPLNINIPLNTEADEETDVAIVVAPTNGIVQTEAEMQSKLNKTLSEEKVNVADIAGILGLKQTEEVESTTIMGSSTTDSSTQESTTKSFETTTNTEGSTSEFNALFFLDPKRQVEVKTENFDGSTTMLTTFETDAIDTSTMKKTTTSDYSFFQMDQALPDSDMLVPFSDTKREAIKPNDFITNDEQTTESSSSTKVPIKNAGVTLHNLKQQALPLNSSMYHFKTSTHQESTTNPILLTPIDNSLSDQNMMSTTESFSTSTKSILPMGFQKPLNDISYNNNDMKLSMRFGEILSTNDNQFMSTNSVASVTEAVTVENTDGSISSTNFAPTSDTTIVLDESHPTTFTSKNNTISFTKVRFPTETPHLIRFPSTLPTQQTSVDQTKQFVTFFNQYINTKAPDLSTNSDFAYPQDVSQVLYQRYKAHRENHRNREKHSEWFHLPAKWSDSSQKPVVLRFSRKHGYIDTQQLGSNNFYREINPRLFGFPAKTRIHR